jgi:hypothetical protein
MGVVVAKVQLTPQQRDVFGDVAGHLAHSVMDQLVNSPSWATMPDMVKAEAFKLALSKGAQVGKVAALSDEQRQAEVQRIVAAVSKRLTQ